MNLPTELSKSELATLFGYTLKTLAKRLIPVLGEKKYKSVRIFGFGDLIKIFQNEGCPPRYDNDWIQYKTAHRI